MKKLLITAMLVTYLGIMVFFFLINAGSLGAIYQHAGIIKDGILHFFAFFVLALLIRFSLNWSKNTLAWTFGLAIAFAVVIEFTQIYMPSRHAKGYDFLLHVCGIISYLIIDVIVANVLRKYEPEKIEIY